MNDIFVGKGSAPVSISGRFANRHGLIAGATGTGKTITVQSLMEGFSDIGVPVFATDIKGDLSGIAAPGTHKDFLTKRADELGMTDYTYKSYPTKFWDVYGNEGEAIKVSPNKMDLSLLGEMLELSPAQADVLFIVFKVARDHGFEVIDIDDFRNLLSYCQSAVKKISEFYGLITSMSISGIQRALLRISDDGADQFMQSPSFDITTFIKQASDGRGMINILSAEKLYRKPRMYSMFVTWMLLELFDKLPERGDADKPLLVFFFDEAHLLFNDAPPSLLDAIERTVRLIRSKGVGVYFITQSPTDVPDTVLGQLGNRVQHALRAFTPRDQKAVRVAAETFRSDGSFSVEEVITTLGVGQALVSVLEDNGIPSYVISVKVRPPQSQIGPIDPSLKG